MTLTKFAPVAFAGAFFGLVACAPLAPELVAPQDASAIDAVCTKIMRLEKGEASFEGCTTSLTSSLESAGSAYRYAAGSRECIRQGLKPDTPEMSTCVLNHENAGTEGIAPLSGVSMGEIERVAASDSDQGSYYTVTPEERYRREQYTCAQLSFEPGTASFDGCVANLDATLFAIAHEPS
jgi:hypothetical protein